MGISLIISISFAVSYILQTKKGTGKTGAFFKYKIIAFYPAKAAAPLTISVSSVVIAAWRAWL